MVSLGVHAMEQVRYTHETRCHRVRNRYEMRTPDSQFHATLTPFEPGVDVGMDWMDGCTDGCMDGRMYGRVDGCITQISI